MNRLKDLLKLPPIELNLADRRGFAGQRPQRLLEHSVRESTVDFSLWTHAQGWTLTDTAHLLNLSPRTLRQWQHDARLDASTMPLLGRPIVRSSVSERNAVIGLLNELGPATGLPTLRDCFPNMPRAELDHLLQRFRHVWRRRYQEAQRVLHWQQPGSIWAMDFAEAPQPIDGRYPYLFAVRDLASGQQLLWLPTQEATAQATIASLAMLFAVHGAPLVLKSDNGSTFLAEATLTLLHQFGIIPLFSPPYWPRYNGSIEAGIGSLKTRTAFRAALQGHPGYWTHDDVAYAHAEANTTARPHGPNEPSPEETWQARRPIAPETRAQFQATLTCRRAELPSDGVDQETKIPTQEARAIDRQAVQRALIEHGFLLFTRRRIPLPFPKKKVAFFS
jgi:transposase InsO family protein